MDNVFVLDPLFAKKLLQDESANFSDAWVKRIAEDFTTGRRKCVLGTILVNGNHWITYLIDFENQLLSFGNSFAIGPSKSVIGTFSAWLSKISDKEVWVGTLTCARQKDNISCAILVFNAIEHLLNAEEHPLLDKAGSIELSRLEKMRDALAHHLDVFPHDFSLNETVTHTDDGALEALPVEEESSVQDADQDSEPAEHDAMSVGTHSDGHDSSTNSVGSADDGASDMDGSEEKDSCESEADISESEAAKSDAASHKTDQPSNLCNRSIRDFFQPVLDKEAWQKEEQYGSESTTRSARKRELISQRERSGM
ncbi:hypothetical protein EWM64_g2977 [Hericium alpestre]|uniref:Ubiquitin-like protease family profile domain-containing protein n=1 Tax=Hericium alpestre TaxID=135208 RepID=A0A4Z0A5R8_9AGAM|nr:hypothetical protein EWM64_g2977 [Hericium alpestre]